MALEIRTATHWDRDDLFALLSAQLSEHHVALADAKLRAAIDGVFEDPRVGTFLIAREEGTAVGVACLSRIWTLEHGGASVWLDELYVVPARRDAGIGTALLREAIAWAKAQGLLAVDLEVEESQARVEALYRREGFEPHTRRRWVKRLA